MVLLAISIIQMSRFAYSDRAPKWEGKIVCPFTFSAGRGASQCCSHSEISRFEVLTAVAMNILVFWDTTPCALVCWY